MSYFCKPERRISVPWAEMREQSRYEENTLMRWAFRRNWERNQCRMMMRRYRRRKARREVR